MSSIPDEQRSPHGNAKRPAAQIAASKRAAETKTKNAPRVKAAALINTPGLTGEAPTEAPVHHYDEQHVHGARAPPTPLRQWVRFKDLRTANIVSNWPQLLNLIETQGFPVGRYFGPNSRAWAADEVVDWLEARPVGIRRDRDKRAAEQGGVMNATPAPRPIYTLRVRPERDCANPVHALRALLKSMLRKYKLRCLSAEQES